LLWGKPPVATRSGVLFPRWFAFAGELSAHHFPPLSALAPQLPTSPISAHQPLTNPRLRGSNQPTPRLSDNQPEANALQLADKSWTQLTPRLTAPATYALHKCREISLNGTRAEA